MLAKIFAVFLGIIGVTTTTVNFPAMPANRQPATTDLKTATVTNEKIAKKIATSTNLGNNKNSSDKSGNFNQLKSSDIVSKTTTTTVKVATKTQTKKSSAKPEVKPSTKVPPPVVVAPKTSEAPRPATNSPTVFDSQTYQFTNLPTNPAPPPIDWNPINQKTREAIVNILCTSKFGGSFEPLSGSGIIVDSRGIILTNAHVAQYFLLENYRVKNFLTCIARVGSPATTKYTLKLLYISQQWLQDNYKNITNQKPTGTGENDYALLQITGGTNPDIKSPTVFPAITFEDNEDNVKINDQVLLASYPAGFLGGIAIQRDLYAVSTIVNLGKLYTFKDGTLDAFGLGGSPVAQHGSSGGAVVSTDTKLIGIIVTSTDGADTSKRDLDAISISHINRSLSTEIHLTLDSLFASDITAFSKTFDEEISPNLKKLLIDELDSKNH